MGILLALGEDLAPASSPESSCNKQKRPINIINRTLVIVKILCIELIVAILINYKCFLIIRSSIANNIDLQDNLSAQLAQHSECQLQIGFGHWLLMCS